MSGATGAVGKASELLVVPAPVATIESGHATGCISDISILSSQIALSDEEIYQKLEPYKKEFELIQTAPASIRFHGYR